MPDPNTTTPAPAAAREPVTPCPECGGLSGAHGMVHTRHGNGGGSNRPCSRREPVTQDDREVVRNAVGGVLRDVSNYPERAQSALWGRDMGSLVERVTDAILAARPSVPTVTAEQRARLIALTYASDDGTEYEHDHDEQDGGAPDCPACWAGAIRAALGTEVQPTCQTQADEDAVTYPLGGPR